MPASCNRRSLTTTEVVSALDGGDRWDILRICHQSGRWAMMQVTIGKWGKNLAVRLPGEIVKASGLRDGERVEIETQDGAIIIRRAVPQFTLEELFAGKSAEEWRALYEGAYDWGPDVGREVVEE
jgi:antitoxin MazE